MADNDFPTLVSATTAANAATNPIFTQLTDGTDTVNVTGAGELEVTLTTALPAGSNNIGDVDVLSVIPGVGATNLGKAEDAAHTSGDTGVAMLVLRQDSQSNLVADGDYTLPTVNSTGELRVTGGGSNASVVVDDTAFTPATSSITTVGYFADETTPDSVDEGDTGAARMTLDRKQLIVLVDATTDTQRLAIDSSGNAQTEVNNGAAGAAVNIQDGGNSITIDNTTLAVVGGGVEATALRVTIASDSTGLLSIDDNGGSLTVDQPTHDNFNANVNLQVGDTDVSTTVPVPISATTAQNTETNPIFVQSVTTGVSASEVHDYDTATVAGGGTSNHDYTVVNATFLLKQIHFASSGALKVEVQTGPVASLVSIAVGFLPKQGGKNEISFEGVPNEVPVASTGTVRVIRTNREGSSNDVYSTIVGNDV